MTRDDERTVRALRGLADRQEEFGPVPVAELLHRGRRARRLRTATRTAAGAGCLVLAAGVLLAVRPAAPDPLPAPPAGPTRTATPDPPQQSTPPTDAPPSDEALLGLLKASLPAGTFSELRGPIGWAAGSGGRWISVRYDDGTGAGQMSVSVVHRAAQAKADGPELSCPDPKIDPYEACRTGTLSDGTVVRTLRTPLYGMGRDGYTEASVVLAGKDGRLVVLKANNATVSKTEPLTRTTPPLTTDQLTAAAQADGWDGVVAALPVSTAQQSRTPGIPGEQVLATATALLPAGLTAAEPGTADPGTGGLGYANFTVADAQGPSLVEIVLQDRRADLQSAPDPASGWQILPDGTRIRDREEPREPGRRLVEALRPDGLWIMVVGYASGRLKQPATRQEPLLTMEQLRAVALGPAWKLPG
ncbi:hypothetical protein ACIRPK_06850 [Kitasatospora sp. NPDC101801]|uniref:hypothetical protein n=1 Tax=Kitasatospora sp. NPDC101801 TaxID=3364103 RepID=UPI003826C20E